MWHLSIGIHLIKADQMFQRLVKSATLRQIAVQAIFELKQQHFVFGGADLRRIADVQINNRRPRVAHGHYCLFHQHVHSRITAKNTAHDADSFAIQ